MKPLCFVLDGANHGQMPQGILQGEWRSIRTHAVYRFQRRYLDSLDWRLLRNGLSLVADRLEGGFQLRLIGLGAKRTLLEASADHLPVFAPSLPAEEWRTILEPILCRRSLVPHILLAVTRHGMAVRDGRGDTVAHIDLELSRARAEGRGKTNLLDRRLRYVPVQGYEKQNRAIVNALSECGLPVNCAVPSAAQLAATLNIDITRFDSKPSMAFHAADRCDIAVKRLLGFFLSVMEVNRPAIVADIDSDCLHDFRVAVRRSRSLLGQMRGVIAKRRQGHARAFLSQINEITNRQRDLDVMLLNFDFYRSLLPSRTRRHLDPVYACIVEQRRAAIDVTARFLRSTDYRRFIRGWRKYLDGAPPRRPAPGNAAKSVKVLADARIWKVYKRILAEGGAIDDASPAEALHRLRKSCKTLRYLIEFFASLYPGGKIQRVLEALKRLQDNLGEYQDLHIHGELLASTRGLMAEQGHLTPESDAAIARIVRAVALRGGECRERFRKRYAVFGGEGHERLFKRLFKP
jgi:CHAD domain-containing protein